MFNRLAQLGALLEASDGIAVANLEGTVLEVNRTFEAMYGWSSEEVVGTVWPQAPSDPLAASECVRLLAEGAGSISFESVIRSKSGADVYAHVKVSPLYDSTGTMAGLLYLAKNNTQQIEAERQLAESEAKYRQLVELSPEPILTIVDYRISEANPEGLRLLGCTSNEEAFGRHIFDFIHADYPAELGAKFEHTQFERQPTELFPLKWVSLDGSIIDVEARLVPVGPTSGGAVQLLVRDISRRKSAEASLQETEELYECLVNNAMAGVYMYQEDNMVYCTPYLSDLFGYYGEEAKSFRIMNAIHPDDKPTIARSAAEATQRSVSAAPFSVRGIRKDRSIVYLEGLITLTRYKGNAALLGTFQDVTSKVEADRELRDSAERYQRLVKFLPEPIVVSDAGLIIYANKLAMKLLRTSTESDLVGHSFNQFIHPDQRDQTKQVLSKVMLTDNASPFQEIKIIRCDGQVIEAEISSIRIHQYMGKTVALTVIRDITDRKQAEELMIRSEKLSLVGQLAAGLAHEIRNPLTSLKGFTQLLKSRSNDDLFYYDTMLRELERINVIVNDFMTLAKPQSAKFGHCNLTNMLDHVVSILHHHAVMMNVNLILDSQTTIPTIYCDENQLQQVFINLIKNAIEAMPSGGDVVISVEPYTSDMICILIKDQGEGMPESIVQKLGEPFLTTKTTGTGLGLMISCRIMEHHGGILQIGSTGKNGTTVKLLLPIAGRHSA
ncbi:MAG: signal transduction histidine kinase, nitrogen specific, NtrB [Paenibacillus sp.]|nr:signal transduction histidine kinase, nitrogen specific, NtrB [Paenibacillus sp.]